MQHIVNAFTAFHADVQVLYVPPDEPIPGMTHEKVNILLSSCGQVIQAPDPVSHAQDCLTQV